MASSRKPAINIAVNHRTSSRQIESYLAKLERLHSRGLVSTRDVSMAYEGAFLTYYTGLERDIERLFIGLLLSKLQTSRASTKPLVQISSHKTARNVLAGDRPYVDWLPIDRTVKRAKKYLSRGEPFDRLEKVDRQVLEQMRIIRNAVAHRSHHAHKVFESELIAQKGLPPDQQKPAGYLRGQHRTGQSRLSYYMAQGTGALQRICN